MLTDDFVSASDSKPRSMQIMQSSHLACMRGLKAVTQRGTCVLRLRKPPIFEGGPQARADGTIKATARKICGESGGAREREREHLSSAVLV